VTHPNAVDFISTVDTPTVAELSIWYHTLNVGFRTRISGETDFPCIYDSRVGIGRTYAQIDGGLTFDRWLNGLRDGRSYVSDGKSHLLDFTVDGVGVGRGGSELRLNVARTVKAHLRVAAYLDPLPNEALRTRPPDQQPFWDIERARIGTTREVSVEIVVNGSVVATRNVAADGQLRHVEFDVPIGASSWIAARILSSSHTNPVFALVGDKPIRASRRSAEWCLTAVDQCWSQKAPAGPQPAGEAQLGPAAPARSDRPLRCDQSAAGAAPHLVSAWPPRSPRSETWPGPGRRIRAADRCP
jgi:hypothetical protein